MVSYLDGMLRYFEFWGRSTRLHYWMFFLVQFVLLIAGVVIDYQMRGGLSRSLVHMPVTLFMIIIHIVPAITVQVRRLHDIGRSGFWYLLNFVPFCGLVLLYWACRASDAGRNNYGDLEINTPALSASSIPAGPRLGTGRRAGAGQAEGRFI
ncbi:DUF805 domain-containing protein [Devosia beringensis]|uniref:DUF805 domain-containing protein n=1 Tax=Devosia beringensis TaxID=2657486 RepID=UPI00186B8023|nr:DUF805 domain-containing protein [Devosia beringensis]